jgi:hypothetical protein
VSLGAFRCSRFHAPKTHLKRNEAATFGYPRVRSFWNSGPRKTFGYPRQAPC